MGKFKTLIILITFVTVVILLFYNGRNLDHVILGEWLVDSVQEFQGEGYIVDCREMVSFGAGGLYDIKNDCETSYDNREGLVESGSWGFFRDRIILTDRLFSEGKAKNYFYMNNSSPRLSLVIDFISKTKIKIKDKDCSRCEGETYTRVDNQ
jgi:hypothetical protein